MFRSSWIFSRPGRLHLAFISESDSLDFSCFFSDLFGIFCNALKVSLDLLDIFCSLDSRVLILLNNSRVKGVLFWKNSSSSAACYYIV